MDRLTNCLLFILRSHYHCLFIFFLIISKTFAHSSPHFPLDSAFIQAVKQLEAQDILDGELLIASGDTIVFSAKSKEISNPSAQFMIGSLSKQFFAAALLKALYEFSPQKTEKDKIEDVKKWLHQPISLFLTRDNFWKHHMPRWAHAISLHQLLNHTSGLPNYTETEAFNKVLGHGKAFFEHPHSKKEIIQLIADQSLLFKPGTEYAYSNTGYILVAEFIELLSGLTASEYLQQKIFTPLQLHATFSPENGQWSSLKKQACFSHLVPQWKYDPQINCMRMYPNTTMIDISNAIGTGSIISTAQDLLKWNLALHQRHFLPAPLYELMVAASHQDYGYGIGIEKSALGPALGHQGSIDAYRTALFYFPNYQLSIIYLTNTAYDWSKLQKEMEQRLLELEETEEAEEIVSQELMQKYPDQRGFNRLLSLIDEALF
jgi:CubicO group peptidase (beta-lactamase class C family)